MTRYRTIVADRRYPEPQGCGVSAPRPVYSFMGGWERCPDCGRTLALVAPGKPKRHKCDPSLPDQEWRRS